MLRSVSICNLHVQSYQPIAVLLFFEILLVILVNYHLFFMLIKQHFHETSLVLLCNYATSHLILISIIGLFAEAILNVGFHWLNSHETMTFTNFWPMVFISLRTDLSSLHLWTVGTIYLQFSS